jgi:amino acid transporter
MSSATKYNTDLATRQMQINEWYYSNKMETLFIFQLVFIALCFFAVLFYLNKLGYLSTALLVYAILIVIAIIVIVIVNRISYTNNVRDKRFWNRRQFGYLPPNIPSLGSSTSSYSTVYGSPPGGGGGGSGSCPAYCSSGGSNA